MVMAVMSVFSVTEGEVLQREQRHLFEIYNGGDDMAEDIKFIRKTYSLLLNEGRK